MNSAFRNQLKGILDKAILDQTKFNKYEDQLEKKKFHENKSEEFKFEDMENIKESDQSQMVIEKKSKELKNFHTIANKPKDDKYKSIKKTKVWQNIVGKIIKKKKTIKKVVSRIRSRLGRNTKKRQSLF